MSIKAITHIRRLRGGSQAQLMVADDGHEYVIKFQGNPQTTRVLANEYLAGRLARMIRLNVPQPAIIHVGTIAVTVSPRGTNPFSPVLRDCPGGQCGYPLWLLVLIEIDPRALKFIEVPA